MTGELGRTHHDVTIEQRNRHARPLSSSRLSFVAACAAAASLAWHDALPADVSGSIRFGDENFELDVRTTDSLLPLDARGCNNFDLSFLPGAPTVKVEFRSAKGTPIGAAGPSKVIEVRTCKAARYRTELAFDAPTAITWRPETDESLGTKKVRYTATVAPVEIRFDPPVELTIFDQNKRTRPMRLTDVAHATVQGGAQLAVHSDALHFQSTGATIRREGGFRGSDSFSLTTDGRPISPPAIGRGSEVALDASPTEPTAFSLYYPLRGPHVLAFFKDETQGLPTSLASLRIDGVQQFTPTLTVVRADALTLERSPFDFVAGDDKFVGGSLALTIGGTGSEVRDVRIESAHAQLTFGKDADGTREVSYRSVPGGAQFEVPFRVQIPNAWKPGEHTVSANVSSEGGLRQPIAVTVHVVDRHSTTRIAVLATLAIIVIALGARAVAKRRKAQSREAAARSHFIQQHYDDYARYRERVEGLLAAESPAWPDIEQLLHEFVDAKLHTGLPPAQWKAINEAAKERKARETLQALERALARFDA